jgi:hypothetical protein
MGVSGVTGPESDKGSLLGGEADAEEEARGERG